MNGLLANIVIPAKAGILLSFHASAEAGPPAFAGATGQEWSKYMKGKVAIVTGAAGGIGEACVRALGARGAKVLGTGRNAGKLTALKDALADTIGRAPV